MYVLRNLVRRVSNDTLRTAYYSLFQSVYTYGFLCWGHFPHVGDIFALQRRALRVMEKLGYREDVRSSFIKLRILTVPCMYIYLCLCFFRQNRADYLEHADVHSYNTRNRHNVVNRYVRLQHSRHSVNYYGGLFFNKLPDVIRNLPLKEYRSTLKELFLSRAYFSSGEYLSDSAICLPQRGG